MKDGKDVESPTSIPAIRVGGSHSHEPADIAEERQGIGRKGYRDEGKLFELLLTVNNRKVRLFVEASETLLYVLRNRLNLHGTKEGCSKGECGACTVLVNKEPVCSCITFALSCQGANILTIEGLQENGTLHPLQQAFIDAGAVQCGFCTPGMIMSAYALLMKNTNPKESEIKEALAGNLCRCTGYAKIIKAVTMAAPYFSRINLTNNSQKSSSAGGGSHL